MANTVKVRFKRMSNEFLDVPLPSYQTSESAGMDIRAALKETLILKPKEVSLVPTNLAVEIPAGFELQVRPRSGLAAKHGIGIANAPGTIDSDYRGEIKVIVINYSDVPYPLESGTRIAQLILSKIYRAEIKETDSLNESERGEGGFGHTGLN